ncbi:MAG: type VI secretion system baseplate subunit TssG [Nannocystaceae bacterium]|nr:type VI secretion system baseplate subunit TssG [Nannocystaceae bacterium]
MTTLQPHDSTSGTMAPGAVDVPDAADAADPVLQRLLDSAHNFSFFVAVGMLERLSPGAIRVGGGGPCGAEAIRFRHDPSLAFSAGEISRIERVEVPRAPEAKLETARHRFEITTSFLGLTGSVTPLPMYLAEEVAQADDSEAVRREFLDLFHHRLISFVYRIGIKMDFAREYTRATDDRWSRRVLAMSGFDAYDDWRLKHLKRWQILRLAPLLSSPVRSAHAISVALQDVLGEALGKAKVSLEQYSGGWTTLDTEQRMGLGHINHRLGVDAVLGIQCFDRAGRATVVIGPLGDNFRRFLADGDLYPIVCELLGLLLVEPLELELDLVLSPQSRPPFHLGRPEGGRLGLDAWLSNRGGAVDVTHLRVPLPSDLSRPVEQKSTAHAHAPAASAN